MNISDILDFPGVGTQISSFHVVSELFHFPTLKSFHYFGIATSRLYLPGYVIFYGKENSVSVLLFYYFFIKNQRRTEGKTIFR